MAVHLKSYGTESLFDQALRLWEEYKGEFDRLVSEYRRLLEQKRSLNKPTKRIKLDKIRESDLREEAPDVELLDILNQDEAERYLSLLSDDELEFVISGIQMYAESAIRVSLKGKIRDYKYQLSHFGEKVDLCAIDPKACKSGRKSSRPGAPLNDFRAR